VTELPLRTWQSEFVDVVRAHQEIDCLLVACPAAGKTVGAAAAAAELMRIRGADQLIVVAPTVVVRDQWSRELARIGYRVPSRWTGTRWPEWLHGVCTTYSQVAWRTGEFKAALEGRRTVVIFDEVHHAGNRLSWGNGISEAFGGAVGRLHLSGTPFRSDGDAIPFISYGDEGLCEADYSYDYQRAVSDGVCRPIDFHAHDGLITWRDKDGVDVTARFSERVDDTSRRRRLHASLDPAQPFLRSLLEAAVNDLAELRQEVPDAAGLVVCDTQAHALEVDRLLNEISGTVPVLAISDIPRAHEAISSFAHDADEWLVSVKMVAEGVDIPRLGVIVWATSSSTELMVRQVAGRALRGRPEHRLHPAIVHMPADPRLVTYAERIDVLAGSTPRERKRDDHGQAGPKRNYTYGAESRHEIDPAPFLAWVDRRTRNDEEGIQEISAALGLNHRSFSRQVYRWRNEGSHVHALTLYDYCHALGIDFDGLFVGELYADARAFVADPQVAASRGMNFDCSSALPDGARQMISPFMPAGPAAPIASVPVQIEPPALPDSPEDIAAAIYASRALRADLYRLLNTYTQLRRHAEPRFSVAIATRELGEEVRPITRESSDEDLAEAIDYVNERAAAIAIANPEVVRDLARAKRRAAIS
jgi:superfamily II DNA or RNA helicase